MGRTSPQTENVGKSRLQRLKLKYVQDKNNIAKGEPVDPPAPTLKSSGDALAVQNAEAFKPCLSCMEIREIPVDGMEHINTASRMFWSNLC